MLELRVADGDVGRVIGRGGRTARALRTVVRARRCARAVGRTSRSSVPDEAAPWRPERARSGGGQGARARRRLPGRGRRRLVHLDRGQRLLVAGGERRIAARRGEQPPMVPARGRRPTATASRRCAARCSSCRWSALPEPEEDAFFVFDLVGCAVSCESRPVGVVREVWERPANDVLVLDADGRELLVPFVARRGARGRHRRPPARGRAVGARRAGVDASGGVLELDVFTLFPHWFAWLSEERPGPERAGQRPAAAASTATATTRRSKHRAVDDAPFGGGAGMVLRVDVVAAAVEGAYGVPLDEVRASRRIVALDPGGRVLDDAYARELAASDRRDAAVRPLRGLRRRILEHVATESLSLGPFVVSGGEPAAMVVCDARLPAAAGARSGTSVERGGVVLAGARGRARVPPLHAAGGVPGLARARGPAVRAPRPGRRVAARSGPGAQAGRARRPPLLPEAAGASACGGLPGSQVLAAGRSALEPARGCASVNDRT